ncbi:ZapG family protein [Halomonas sp. BC04]|uniref:ZapG family protein n=1 Tax=Halomonas sp. BC04 TaxID=1403540 RepID=UPI0003ED707C|nr:DUF1043 family protein [Halomonas sp. BC04]EWG99560.1 hypothetical protein Q427_24335 [Halomonas sp. BC04]
MEYGNINWLVAIVSLLAGLGLGGLGYHLFGASASRLQQQRQQLAERERELSELKEGLGEHFSQVGMMVANIQREIRTLEHRVTEDASTLNCESPVTRRLDLAEQKTLAPQADEIPTPRDYADGTGGTLSEDFGLKSDKETRDAPQPPRY